MKGRSGRASSASFNAERPSNERELVIREDQVNSSVLKTGDELGARLNAGYFKDEMIGFKELLNELRVTGVILQQQNPERRCHFFTLPGGGSLMTAQKTPSSFTALTNS